jgi:hypothetical protein
MLSSWRMYEMHLALFLKAGCDKEYLANRIFPTLKEWSMPKLKGEKKKNELVRLPYHFKFKKHFKEPCQE